MIKRLLVTMVAICGLAVQAFTVQTPSSPIKIDGKLDEKAWADAVKNTNFIRVKTQANIPMKDQTSFSVLADENAVYLGITCFDSEMDKVQWKGNIWGSDAIEMFISPAGNPVEYYHMAASCSNDRYSMFRAEAGNITPDKFAPFWETATSKDDKAWYLEVRIPYSAFYMTRNKMWNTTWLLNIARTQTHGGGLSTWAPLYDGFHESKVFRPVKGFPVRKPVEDVFVPVVIGDFTSRAGDVIKGDVIVNVEGNNVSAGKWNMTVQVPGGNTVSREIEVKYGNRKYVAKGMEFPASVKRAHHVKVTLQRGETVLGRYYPVSAEYKPVDIRITWPQYANNYYPGQDAKYVSGVVNFKLSEEDVNKAVIELTIGDEVKKYKPKKDGVEFRQKFRELKEGEEVRLKARLIVDGSEFAVTETSVRRLPPPEKGGSVVWIENGHIVYNGKPYFPRSIYAMGYRGGRLMAQRFEKEKDTICLNNFFCPTLEPERLLPKMNIEAKEATKDVKPCKELFEKVRQVVEKNKGKDILGYYICDEPECRNISPVYLKYIYDYVKELDPYHPVMTCTRSPQRYIECMDVFMMHTYISPMFSGKTRFLSTPIDKTRAQIREVVDYKRPEKVAGFTGQFFSYKFGNRYADYPTWDELQAQTWTTIANGSKVSNPYAYHDINDKFHMFQAFIFQNQCIMELNDWLLSPEVSYLDIKADKWLDCTLYEHDGMELLLMVNPYPEKLTAMVDDRAINGKWYEFRGDKVYKFRKNRPIEFEPYQVYLLTSRKFESKFPKLKDILAKIDAYYHEMNNKGNLLLNKDAEIEIDASDTALIGNAKRKAFDGSLDMIAWGSNRWKKQQWFEMNFPKVSPKFKTIKLYGYNLKNPTFTIWKAGEWRPITPVETKENKDEWSKTFTFDKLNRTVKVRITFNDLKVGTDEVEIYEVEMYDK